MGLSRDPSFILKNLNCGCTFNLFMWITFMLVNTNRMWLRGPHMVSINKHNWSWQLFHKIEFPFCLSGSDSFFQIIILGAPFICRTYFQLNKIILIYYIITINHGLLFLLNLPWFKRVQILLYIYIYIYIYIYFLPFFA